MSNSTFSGINLGDHAWISISTSNEIEVHKIPRADGAIIRRRGGSIKNITVTGWLVKNSRSDVEQFFDQLGVSLGTDFADLIVNGITYSNCILVSISPDTGHNKFAEFTLQFLKNSD